MKNPKVEILVPAVGEFSVYLNGVEVAVNKFEMSVGLNGMHEVEITFIPDELIIRKA